MSILSKSQNIGMDSLRILHVGQNSLFMLTDNSLINHIVSSHSRHAILVFQFEVMGM